MWPSISHRRQLLPPPPCPLPSAGQTEQNPQVRVTSCQRTGSRLTATGTHPPALRGPGAGLRCAPEAGSSVNSPKPGHSRSFTTRDQLRGERVPHTRSLIGAGGLQVESATGEPSRGLTCKALPLPPITRVTSPTVLGGGQQNLCQPPFAGGKSPKTVEGSVAWPQHTGAQAAVTSMSHPRALYTESRMLPEDSHQHQTSASLYQC